MLIAKNRAAYYATIDGFDPYSQQWQDEIEFAFDNDGCELTDWAVNNMTWADVESDAVLVPSKGLLPQDYQDGWANGGKEIIER